MASSKTVPGLEPDTVPEGTPPPGQAPPRARVLIVDDDERNAFAANQALEGMGWDLVVTHSGEEALKRMLVEDFSVVLLDLHMPGMDGFETAELIRRRRRSKDVPIVFLTAIFRDEGHVFQAYSAGAVDVVFKPVDPFILRSKVSVLVELRQKTEEVRLQAEAAGRLLDEMRRVSNEKKEAEQALKLVEERQEAILKLLPIFVVSHAVTPPFAPLFVGDQVMALTGFGSERFLNEPEFALSRVHPEDVSAVTQALGGVAETGAYACEFRWQHANGEYRWFLEQGVLAKADSGDPEIFAIVTDATDRRLLEQQLSQARKMEAVGQLTGGVAHDFNNLLTVILGNVDFLRRGAVDAKASRQLDAVRQAAERGRGLTRQLLAFSRRQHLSPRTVDVRKLMEEFALLVRQAVGDAVSIVSLLDPEPLNAHVDPSELETALLNLAINSRDAMPDGGRLTIRAFLGKGPDGLPANEAPTAGWICLEVADTGVGMPPDVVDRIFEPFFTTKEVGKGSGLGLSQVYGFVRQSGGHVRVSSRVGEGSAFRLYLPATDAKPEARESEHSCLEKLRGTERVLVVEDDPSVLSMAIEMLESLGYEVVSAPDAPSALAILDSGEPVQLILSDVVMPGGVNGLELARAARERRPGIAVLLTSGYTGETARLRDTEIPLIDKPFNPAELAAKLRELLDLKDKPESRRKRAPG